MVKHIRFIARLWYYFRVGYGTYLTFLLGVLNTLTVVYYLLIKNVPVLELLFPGFVEFSIITIVVGAPLAIGTGWLHIKRSPGYSSEVDISTEANPYNYRLIPGYSTEVYWPMNLVMLSQLKRLLEAHELISQEEKAQIEDLEQKIGHLIRGGTIGAPRSKNLSKR